jgi:hypothetical protein
MALFWAGAVFERVTKNIKVMPGSEFRAAAQEGMKYGARIVLGDRPVEVRHCGSHPPLCPRSGSYSELPLTNG